MSPGGIWTWDPDHESRTYTRFRKLGYGPAFNSRTFIIKKTPSGIFVLCTFLVHVFIQQSKWIVIWPKIHLLQGTSCTAAHALRPRVFQLVYCGSCIITYSLSCKTQAAMHNKECSLSHALRLPQCICGCRSLPGWVEFSLPQYKPFYPFPFYNSVFVSPGRQSWQF